MSTLLCERLKDKTAKIGVIGLGYVGLPLCLAIVRNGLEVLGFDIDPAKPQSLKGGESYLKHIDSKQIREANETGLFSYTSDFDQLSEPDIIIICVPTPLTRYREPDLSYLVDTCKEISKRLRHGQMVILESTTYPGTTSEVVRPALEESGLKCDVDFLIAYSPEREDPGNKTFSTSSTPKIIGADTLEARATAAAFYSIFIDKVVTVSDAKTAEMTKLAENIFRSVNIALVNELKIIADAMQIDIWEVIDAARTKPFGYMPFYPGPGLGGHCIPIDPFYLTWKAKEFDLRTRFIELAGEINTQMPYRVVERLAEQMDIRFGKGLSGARILLVGMAYKKNVDDMRESPALKILHILERRGALVSFFDPMVSEIPMTREHPELAGRRSVTWHPKLGSKYDAVLIVTDHDDVDYVELVKSSALVVDTRNACRRAGVESEKLIQA